MIGTQNISTYYVGSTAVNKLYKGSSLIWEAGTGGDPYLIAGNTYLNLLASTYNDPVEAVDNNYNVVSGEVQYGAYMQPKLRFANGANIDVLYGAESFSQAFEIKSSNDFFENGQFSFELNGSGVASVKLYGSDGGLTDQPTIGQYIRMLNMGESDDYTTVRLQYIDVNENVTFSQDFLAYAIGVSYNNIQFNLGATSSAKILKPQGSGLTIIP